MAEINLPLTQVCKAKRSTARGAEAHASVPVRDGRDRESPIHIYEDPDQLTQGHEEGVYEEIGESHLPVYTNTHPSRVPENPPPQSASDDYVTMEQSNKPDCAKDEDEYQRYLPPRKIYLNLKN